ncbi:hypothetical protein I3843_11G059000 [Carya illinoinensis]|uniref:Uncharacterized protein n=1 Tax=Carya illinoinensis TaxID=32201 RepID=A0A922DMD1_CARIL|nr:hypothetical protein I3760_11G058400 [Carya illinoinensis]KAG6687205.1 hypothetical protein I3842_11G059100 [Carya illinoinensis]KAG7955205.1 hypothetical protein I3843_11G059000 [Carya illinoinensis]
MNLPESEMVLVGLVCNIQCSANVLWCKALSLSMKCLGFPFGASYKAQAVWVGLLEKIDSRLGGWKRMYLSRGGRITLIKNTHSNLSTYFLFLFPLPEGVENHIEKIFCAFLWGGTGDVPR